MPVCIPDVSLSQKAFTKASEQLKLDDLFWLSTVSRKHYKRVKNALWDGYRYVWMIVDLTSTPTVEFYPSQNEDDDWPTIFNFYNRRHSGRYGMEGKRTQKIRLYVDGSTERSLVCWKESRRRYGVASDSIEDVIQFVKHLEVLIQISTVYRLHIDPKHLPHLKSIQSSKELKNSNSVTITKEGTISHATFRRVLNGFKTSRISIECDVESKVDFDKIRIPGDYFSIRNCSFLDISMVPKFYDAGLSMGNCKMTNSDVNSFLWQWKESSEKKKWEIKLWKNHKDEEAQGVYDDFWNQEKWDFKKIIDGLEDILVQPQNHSELDESSPSGHFQRKTDALMMKIVVDFSDRSCTKLTIESDYSYVENFDSSRVRQPEYVEEEDSGKEEEEDEEKEASDDVNMASGDDGSEEDESEEDDDASMNSEVEDEAEEHETSSENDDASMNSEVEDESEDDESEEDSEDDDDLMNSDDDLFDLLIDE